MTRSAPAGRCSVGLRRYAEPGTAPAGPAVSAADPAAHRGQHPPRAHAHAPAGTAHRGSPVSTGPPPGAAARGRLFDGPDEIQRTRARHDEPSPASPAPSPCRRPCARTVSASRAAASDGTRRVFLLPIRSGQHRPLIQPPITGSSAGPRPQAAAEALQATGHASYDGHIQQCRIPLAHVADMIGRPIIRRHFPLRTELVIMAPALGSGTVGPYRRANARWERIYAACHPPSMPACPDASPALGQ
jgi:hypothetical protein